MKLKIKVRKMFPESDVFFMFSNREITEDHCKRLLSLTGVGAISKTHDMYKIVVKSGYLFNTEEVMSNCSEILRFCQLNKREKIVSEQLDKEVEILNSQDRKVKNERTGSVQKDI